MKIFMLGLDGMTLKVLVPYIEAGLLPNFKKVLASGCHGILNSTVPSITGPAWTSMVTGKNPGKHGIFEFRTRTDYKTNIVTRNTSSSEPVWNIFNRNNRNSAVINVPFTYPPDKVNGIMVSGMMTPNVKSNFVYPEDFKKELFKVVPDYKIQVEAKGLLKSGDRDKFSKEVFNVTSSNRKLMNYLLDKRRWDLFFFTFMASDRLQHFLWDGVVGMYPECVKCYKLLDDILGDVLDRMDDDTVLFMASDHGFKKIEKAFFINSFFKKLGLLTVRKGQKMGLLVKMLIVAYTVLAKTGLFSLKKYLPSKLVNSVRNFLLTTGFGNKIDWEKTSVFSMLQYGIININLKGRESEGIVEQDEYLRLCREVKEQLLRVVDPQNGKKIIKEVFLGDQLYCGKGNVVAPDLVAVANDGYFIIEKEFGDEIVGENKQIVTYTGDHEAEGFWAAYGNVINNKRVDAEIYDIMPTVLYLMGIAIPEDVDGRVLTGAIDDDFVEKNKIRFERVGKAVCSKEVSLNKTETEQLERQLRSLGYLG